MGSYFQFTMLQVATTEPPPELSAKELWQLVVLQVTSPGAPLYPAFPLSVKTAEDKAIIHAERRMMEVKIRFINFTIDIFIV